MSSNGGGTAPPAAGLPVEMGGGQGPAREHHVVRVEFATGRVPHISGPRATLDGPVLRRWRGHRRPIAASTLRQ